MTSDSLGSWEPRNLIEVAGRAPEPPSVIGVFYAGHRHLLFGAAETLKTWLAAIAVAEVLLAGKKRAARVDVDGGTAEELLERFRQLGVPDDVPMITTDARDRASTKVALLELVQHALVRASAGAA